MERKFTLEYLLDDTWYVGRIKEVPGVFSQGEEWIIAHFAPRLLHATR
jgi:hypothetical protein